MLLAGSLLCESYIIRASSHGPSSRLSGSHCSPVASPSISFSHLVCGCPWGLLQWNDGWSDALTTQWRTHLESVLHAQRKVAKRRNCRAIGSDSAIGYMSGILYHAIVTWILKMVNDLLSRLIGTHTQPFYGPLDFVWDYLGKQVPKRLNQSGFTGATDSEWQWHQLGNMQICTLNQTHNHASIPPLIFYRLGALPAIQPTPQSTE